MSISWADTKTDLLGTEYSGDITFNDIEWLTSREDVVSALKEKFSDVDIEEVVAWDEKQYMEFATMLDEHPEIETAFIVTDSESGYQDMIDGLNVKESYQLYRDYLDNFRINSVRR